MPAKKKRRTPYVLISLLVLLTLGTAALATVAIEGLFVSGWLIPYWNDLTDAQAAIISQLIFFLAATWAALLVPVLFSEKLRDLQDAADAAENMYEDIALKLNESAEESKRQFKSISRYQQMALGYFANDGLLSQLETAQEKKDFIDNAWDHVSPKLDKAIGRLHGSAQNSIASNRYRTPQWWDRIKAFGALGEQFAAFKVISDAKWEVSRGSAASFDSIKKVNDALRAIRDFDPSEGRPDISGQSGAAAQSSGLTPPQTIFTAPTDQQWQQPN